MFRPPLRVFFEGGRFRQGRATPPLHKAGNRVEGGGVSAPIYGVDVVNYFPLTFPCIAFIFDLWEASDV